MSGGGEPLSEELERKVIQTADELIHWQHYEVKRREILRAFAREIQSESVNNQLTDLKEKAQALEEALETLTIETGCADGDCCETGFKHKAAIERGQEVLRAYRDSGRGKP